MVSHDPAPVPERKVTKPRSPSQHHWSPHSTHGESAGSANITLLLNITM